MFKMTVNRVRRLNAARKWLATLEEPYSYKWAIRTYKKKFKVPFYCALEELKFLGVKIANRYYRQHKYGYFMRKNMQQRNGKLGLAAITKKGGSRKRLHYRDYVALKRKERGFYLNKKFKIRKTDIVYYVPKNENAK